LILKYILTLARLGIWAACVVITSIAAEFVEFSQNTNGAIHELTALLTNKDQEIQLLKDEVNTLNI
jgi:hypothetical protein